MASANRYARDHGLTPFVIYQGMWGVLSRDFEREIIPIVRHEGTGSARNTKPIYLFNFLRMALAPWNVLATGKLRTDEEERRREK